METKDETVIVPEDLKSKNDGRKKPWYVKRIEALEDDVKRLSESQHLSAANERYAQGYFDCLSKYGVLSKLQRRRLYDRLKEHGPSAAKGFKGGSLNVPLII